jgi:twitching motility two-component system response regulator PilG
MVTVLVVEDNAITRNIVRLALSSQGYRVLEAADGASAISAMTDQRPDLVIQDLALPDIDGMNLAQILHRLPGCGDVPIIAFSAFVDKLEVVRNTQDIFRAFLPKPILPSKLIELVKRITRNEQQVQAVNS